MRASAFIDFSNEACSVFGKAIETNFDGSKRGQEHSTAEAMKAE